MAIGAAGFVVYCLAAVPLCRRLGTWPVWASLVAASAAWAVTALGGYVIVRTMRET